MHEPRISVEEGVKAYQETGLTPAATRFFGWEDCRFVACGLGALYAHAFGPTKASEAWPQLEAVYGDDYTSGFAFAFDGALLGRSQDQLSAVSTRMGEGFEDGRAVALAVKDGVPVPDHVPEACSSVPVSV